MKCHLGATRYDTNVEPGFGVKCEVCNGKKARFLVSTLGPIWFPSLGQIWVKSGDSETTLPYVHEGVHV